MNFILFSRTHSSTRGSAVISSALIILSIMFLLIFSFQTYTGLIRRKSKKYEHVVKARNAAFTVSEAAMNILLKQLSKDSGLEKKIKKGELSDYHIPSTALFKALEYKKSDYSLSAEISFKREQYVFDPSDETCGFSPDEVRGTALLTATAEFRGTASVIQRKYPYSVISPCVPVVSAFTLFMVSAGIHGSDFFNVCKSRIDGTIPNDAIFPLVLKNNPETPKALQGMVYLGQSRVDINISSGPSGYGEDFMFYNTRQRKRPVYIVDSEPPELFLSPHTPSPYVPPQAWHVLHTFHGFYMFDSAVKESGMQRQSEYDTYYRNFRIPGRTGAESSWLRLFGLSDAVSYTRVFGNVYARFAMLSALGIDVDSSLADEASRGVSGMDIDAVAATLPMIGKDGFERCKKDPPLFPFKPFSQVYKNRNDSSRPEFKDVFVDMTKINYSSIFKDFKTYSRYMSRIIEGMPFNCMKDFKDHSSSKVPDRETASIENILELKADTADTRGIYFSGPISKADPAGVLKKVQRYYSNAGDFLKAHVKNNVLSLGCCVYIDSKELRLPQNLEAASGGIIINSGDLFIRGIKSNSRLPLTLVSEKGDIVIHPFSGPVEAGLVVLSSNRRLRSAGNSSKEKLRIKGHLCVPMIDPFEFPAGGILEYDPLFHPLHMENRNLMLHISEKSRELEVIK